MVVPTGVPTAVPSGEPAAVPTALPPTAFPQGASSDSVTMFWADCTMGGRTDARALGHSCEVVVAAVGGICENYYVSEAVVEGAPPVSRPCETLGDGTCAAGLAVTCSGPTFAAALGATTTPMTAPTVVPTAVATAVATAVPTSLTAATTALPSTDSSVCTIGGRADARSFGYSCAGVVALVGGACEDYYISSIVPAGASPASRPCELSEQGECQAGELVHCDQPPAAGDGPTALPSPIPLSPLSGSPLSDSNTLVPSSNTLVPVAGPTTGFPTDWGAYAEVTAEYPAVEGKPFSLMFCNFLSSDIIVGRLGCMGQATHCSVSDILPPSGCSKGLIGVDSSVSDNQENLFISYVRNSSMAEPNAPLVLAVRRLPGEGPSTSAFIVALMQDQQVIVYDGCEAAQASLGIVPQACGYSQNSQSLLRGSSMKLPSRSPELAQELRMPKALWSA
mmetsp:Transcript_70632/g.153392  ORF Transcript_70632/g.153392 Transcript_70632/m.153392 type:complete len:450 (+) Transcript_70632:2-1351(+)